MKTILTLAAALAAFTTASTSFAQTPVGGHWEWQARSTPGPNRANLPQQVRVWIKDVGSDMADCNCAMMKMGASDCMMGMPGKPKAPSAG